MGRTTRARKKRSKSLRPTSLGDDEEFLSLTSWLSSKGWKPSCKLSPYHFPSTGRGLMSKETIPVGTELVKIPFDVLITVKTVSESHLGSILNNLEVGLTTQQVLCAFLAYEKHLHNSSVWHKYIFSLPKNHSSPLFCLETELEFFPQNILDKIKDMNNQVVKTHEILNSVFKLKTCLHCGQDYSCIFSLDLIKWSWFTVNSRCVYLSPEINFSHKINLIDSNCLALAPYLDMLNHSNEAKVNAFFNLKDSTYTVKTLVPFKKYEEAFINYGSHNNIKLFLEYGFIIPKNHHDVVLLYPQSILNASKKLNPALKNLLTTRYDYLEKHSFLDDLSCTSDGLSWNAKVVFFVLSAPATADLLALNRQIFAGDSACNSAFVTLAQFVLNEKIKETYIQFQKAKESIENSFSKEILKILVALLDENLAILYNVTKKLGPGS